MVSQTDPLREPAAGRRVVVTGGAGFLGSWLCERLLDQGAQVVCVDNFITGSADNVGHLRERAAFELVEADVSTALDVPGEVDWVLHLASPASPVHYLSLPIETMRVGSLGTMNALEPLQLTSNASFRLHESRTRWPRPPTTR